MNALRLAWLLTVWAVAGSAWAGESLAELERAFANPPDDARIVMRWWWFGPAVTPRELEREMRAMKDAGIGGFEVQPVYPLGLDDAASGVRNLPYLSDEFLEALRFTAEKAHELGLRFDLTLGSGWPYGGPQVPIRQAAGRLRVERVRVAPGARRVVVPSLGSGEELLAAFVGRLEGDAVSGDGFRELTDVADGVLRLPTPADRPQLVLFFVASRTGMMVKRAAVGAEGYVVDHYDRAATAAYLAAVGDRLLRACGPHPPYAVFCDSLEVYGSDWTGDLLDAFRQRRGYDLRPLLPALAGDAGKTTLDVRHDWGRTLTELFEERFLAPLAEWARGHGTRLRVQAYGTPPALVSTSALADLPEGEGWQWKTLRPSRWASSAGHVYGRTVTSSETWTWLHSPSFRATPLDMKAEADLHFLQGINQLVGHGWPYSAEGVPYPGWRFYAAGALNDRNPWWIVMPDLALYLQRVSFVLRQGRPAADVAVYLPNHDAWSELEAGKIRPFNDTLAKRVGDDAVAGILEAGFGLDFFDDRMLRDLGRTGAGELGLGAGAYPVVVLANVERIPLDTLRRLEAFARGGGLLVATRRLPERAPGLLDGKADSDRVREIARLLFGPGGPGRFVADERQLGRTLASLRRPDVQLGLAAPDVGFVHRATDVADVYFLANTSNRPQRVSVTFRVERRRGEWWDPMDGRVLAADVRWSPGRGASVDLDLEPYGSRVLAFTARRLPTGGAPRASTTPTAAIDLSRDWTVTFGDSAAPTTLETLRSWTEDETTRFFSGQARYEKRFEMADRLLRNGLRLRLEFGDGVAVAPVAGARFRGWLDAPVREAAVVEVNGRRAGSVWCPPFTVDVTGLLRRGENTLRVTVGNLAVNHLAGRARPDHRLLNLRYGVRFEDQDQDEVQPVPSGLLGPVRLVATAGR